MTATLLLVAYALAATCMVSLDVWARWRGRRDLTMGGVLEFLMRTRPGRWFVLLGWWWLGWHVFVRSTP